MKFLGIVVIELNHFQLDEVHSCKHAVCEGNENRG